eukprot:5850125-Heterocapsa_arctica.AAC.1
MFSCACKLEPDEDAAVPVEKVDDDPALAMAALAAVSDEAPQAEGCGLTRGILDASPSSRRSMSQPASSTDVSMSQPASSTE